MLNLNNYYTYSFNFEDVKVIFGNQRASRKACCIILTLGAAQTLITTLLLNITTKIHILFRVTENTAG